MDRVALGQVCLPVLLFSPVSIIPPMLHIHFICMLLLADRQVGEAWEPSEKQRSFGKRGAFTRRVLSFNFKTSAQTQPSKSYPTLVTMQPFTHELGPNAVLLRTPAAKRCRHYTVTLPSSLPNVLPCFTSTFTRRSNGHCLETWRAENLLFSPLLSPAIIVLPFAASTSTSASSLLYSGMVSDVTELTEDSTSPKCVT